MKLSTFSIHGDGSTRRVCVVNGQAFYQSSGTSSYLPGVWVPFRGVIDDRFSSFVGMIQKPTVTNIRRAKIGDYFPPEVLEVIKSHMPQSKDWGRLQNINCLIISCMLSPEAAFPSEIKAAVLKYIEPNTLPTVTFQESAEPPVQLENYNVDKINDKLLAMGANAKPEPVEEDPLLPYVFTLEETQYDPNHFDPTQFIQELHTESIIESYKKALVIGRHDSTDSVTTDTEIDSEEDAHSP